MKVFPISLPSLAGVLLSLMVAAAPAQVPTFSKGFSPGTVGPGGTSTLTFTISNPGSAPVSNLAFTDVLPAGLTIANPAGVASDCRGTISAPPGGSTISLTDGSIGGNSTCRVRVNVSGVTPGTHLNVSGDLTSSAGNSGVAEAELVVEADRPGFTKKFSPDVVRFGGRSRLTFTIDNSQSVESNAFNPEFTDRLPSGMVIANPANVFTDCQNSTVTAVPGTDLIRLAPTASTSLIPAGAVCTLSVDVIAMASGALGNVSGELTTSGFLGGASRSSGFATAQLIVTNDPIVLTAEFIGDPTGPGSTVDLEFSIFNLSRDGASDIAFLADLDAVVPGGGMRATGLPLSVCGGTLSTPDAGSTIEFSGGSLPGSNGLADGSNACTFTVPVRVPAGAPFGEFLLNTSTITAQSDGSTVTGGAAAAPLFISPSLVLTKSFTDDPVAAGGQVTLEYTLSNPNPGAATAVTFTDELTTFLPATVTADLPADGFCGPGSSAVLISPGTDRLSVMITGAEIPANSSCTFGIVINVPGDVSNGSYPSTTSAVTGSVDGSPASGDPASDSLVVVGLPTLSKSFSPNAVLAGATTTLEFTISLDENAPGPATGLSFSDDLEAVLPGLATTPGLSLSGVCGPGSTLVDSSPGTDGSEISLVGGILQPGESRTFAVDVIVPAGASSGSYTNTTSDLQASVGGLQLSGVPATADLNIANLVLSKEFIDDPVIAGGEVTVRYTLTNNSPTLAATAISFQEDFGDDLPGLVATGLPLSDVCGAGSALVGAAGNTLVTFFNGTLDPLDSCSFEVTLNVPAGTASQGYPSSTEEFEATIDGAQIDLPNASDTLTVSSELLQLTKEFTDDPVAPGGTVTLEFTLSNIGSSDVSDISFTDDLGAALPGLVAVGLPASGVCGPGSSLSGTGVITLSGASLVAGADCTFNVTLQVPANLSQARTVTNTTSAVSGLVGNLAVFGSAASDDLNVRSPVASAPDVTIEQAAGQADPVGAGPIHFTVVFDQPVSGFMTGDVNLSSGTGTVSQSFPFDGTTYDVAVTGMDEGTLTATVPGSVARNAASVGNNPSTSTDNQVTFDKEPPVITLNGAATVTIECGIETYVELGATAEDSLDGPVPVTVGGDTVNSNLPGTYTVTYSASDSNGNSSGESRTVEVVDTTSPTITRNGAATVTIECGLETYTELGATVADACDPDVSLTIGGDTVDPDTLGTYTITYDAVDAHGNAATQVTRTVEVVDTLAPEIEASKDIVLSAPAGGPAPAVSYQAPSAVDLCDGAVAVTCSPPSGSTFPVGVTTVVTCTATDASGNVGVATFNVVVLEIADTPGVRYLEAIALRGDPANGATGTIFNPTRAFLNNNGQILFSASLSGAGASNAAVFLGPVAGPHSAIAVKGTESGVGEFGGFSDLALNDAGDTGFASPVGGDQGHFVNGSVAALKDAVAPATGGGELYRSLQKPALAANGELLTRANLILGSGAGVTTADDTIITSSAGVVIAREGSVTGIPALNYGGLQARVVTSEDNGCYAFSASLKPSTSQQNAALFSGVLGAGAPALVVRKGDAADGAGGATFNNFVGEAVNSANEIVVRALLSGPGIVPSNNEGLWTNVGDTNAPPVLVAREGEAVPCLPPGLAGLVAFDRFSTIAIGDDGSVCFFAFLRDATQVPAVNSTNDGSIWRWAGGQLHLIAREGDLANNTDGAVIDRLDGFACSRTGAVVYLVSYVTGQGDATAANRDGLYLDRGAADDAPKLVLRRSDTFEFMDSTRTVTSLRISTEENAGGGTGGYGRAINDEGSIILNLSLSGNLSGLFVLGMEPAQP